MEEEVNEYGITKEEMAKVANEWWDSLTKDEKDLLFQEQMMVNDAFIKTL